MISRRSLFAGTLLASLSLGSAALALAAPASPQTYALKASDLGRGYTVTSTKVLSNAAFAKQVGVPKAQFDQHGRITGLQVQFEQKSTADLAFSYIYTYKTAAGAHWDWQNSTKHDLKSGKTVSAPKVGAESVALFAQQKQGTLTAVFYVVDFRQGPIDNTVGVGGLKGQVTLAQAVRDARIVAAREPKS